MGKLKRIEIDIKDSGAVVHTFREPDKKKDGDDCYDHCYWDNREEHAFDDVDKAVSKVEEMLGELKQ